MLPLVRMYCLVWFATINAVLSQVPKTAPAVKRTYSSAAVNYMRKSKLANCTATSCSVQEGQLKTLKRSEGLIISGCNNKTYFLTYDKQMNFHIWRMCCQLGLQPASFDDLKQMQCVHQAFVNSKDPHFDSDAKFHSAYMDATLDGNFISCATRKPLAGDLWLKGEPGNMMNLENCAGVRLAPGLMGTFAQACYQLNYHQVMCESFLDNIQLKFESAEITSTQSLNTTPPSTKSASVTASTRASAIVTSQQDSRWKTTMSSKIASTTIRTVATTRPMLKAAILAATSAIVSRPTLATVTVRSTDRSTVKTAVVTKATPALLKSSSVDLASASNDSSVKQNYNARTRELFNTSKLTGCQSAFCALANDSHLGVTDNFKGVDSKIGQSMTICSIQYVFIKKKVAYAEIWDKCCKVAMVPASIETKEQLACLTAQLTPKTTAQALLFFTAQLDANLDRTFVSCSTGNAVLADVFFAKEPNNIQNTEACVALKFASTGAGLIDINCEAVINVICERRPGDYSSPRISTSIGISSAPMTNGTNTSGASTHQQIPTIISNIGILLTTGSHTSIASSTMSSMTTGYLTSLMGSSNGPLTTIGSKKTPTIFTQSLY